MKFCTLSLISCCFILTVESGRSTAKSKGQNDPSNEAPDFSNLTFSGFLYEAVKEGEPQNFVLSPFSLRNALALVTVGAAGETAKENQQQLKFPTNPKLIREQSELISSLNGISSQQNSGVSFVTADKIYANGGLHVKFQYKNDVEQLGGEVENVNFGENRVAAGKINKWIQEKTAGKIDRIVDSQSLSGQTSLLALNSIYFKGVWENPFPLSNTRPQPFFTGGNNKVMVDMMTQTDAFRFGYLEDADAQVLTLPYKEDRLSMMIFLPNRKENEPATSLDTLEKWLKNKSPFDIQKERLKRRRTVAVSLPKFKIRSSFNLNEPLKTFGLRKMFNAAQADFSGIFDGPRRFFVSKVSQETFIEVNEEGTEAAAATGFEVGATSAIQTPQFTANRPFLFQILDSTTETVLFTGRVKNPLAQ